MNEPQDDLPTSLRISEKTLSSLNRSESASIEDSPHVPPLHIGRYRVQRVLGKGGFGIVYLAQDEQLQRSVAIKVPYRHVVSSYQDAAAYLTEARAIANLDHPNIVPVHDVGGTEECPCFIVTRFIEGTTLLDRIRGLRPSSYEAAGLTATIADALHYAHRKGLVHRDIKPGNILIDPVGKPFVVDFGLALTAETLGQGPRFAGTPGYMSPEQASGEGHLVDGRSDIFSLGVVFYEMLVGRAPFKGKPLLTLIQQIISQDVVPPRQLDDTIPRELERICLKALAKRPAERYTTACDLADDIRQFLDQGLAKEKIALVVTSGLVQRLLDAEIVQVPGIIREIENHRALAEPLLRRELAAGDDTRQKLHASLALLPMDASQVDYLYDRLLSAGHGELPIIANALRGYRDAIEDRLWRVLESEQETPDRRFRAGCVLANYNPGGDDVGDARWRKLAPFLAAQLLAAVQRNPSDYMPLLDRLRPVRAALIAPLAEAFRDARRSQAEHFFATNILAEYAWEQPDLLVDFLLDADRQAFAVLFPAARAHLANVLAHLQPAKGPTPEDQERAAQRQANAAVALLRMNRPELVWPMLRHSPDPRVRSHLIHRLGPMGVAAEVLAARLADEPDVSIRRAIILSLGEFPEDAWSPPAKDAVRQTLRAVFHDTGDAGLHGACDWLLRRWGDDAFVQSERDDWTRDADRRQRRLDEIRHALATRQGDESARWYVNRQGQTMVVIPGPVEFLMGSPETEEGRFETESRHRRRIGRSFAIAAKAVTVEQFLRFQPDYAYFRQYAPSADCPIHQTTWYLAAAYCNWLSEQEGIPSDQWCYVPNARGQYAVGMRLTADYLRRAGYRLPTEAEWEFACRAGAVTSRYFGESANLLTQYGVRSSDLGRSEPVGSFKPNDFGLFDMHGNVWCWCQEKYLDYPQADPAGVVEDREGSPWVSNEEAHVLRGGSFLNPAVTLRSAYRFGNVPANRSAANGFRLARTITVG